MDTKRFILRDWSIRDRCKTYLDTLDMLQDKPVEVVIKPYKKNRSVAQNNLMWMWLTKIANFMRDEHGQWLMEHAGAIPTPEDLKDYLQRRHLGFKTYPMPGFDYFADRVIGTSDLNTAQFTEFLGHIERYANAELGVQLPHPEDLYYEAMGR